MAAERERLQQTAGGRGQQYNTFRGGGGVGVAMEVVRHTLDGSETLQGLAIKYDVPMRAILAANHLWARDDIHTRKYLLIPRPAGRAAAAAAAAPTQPQPPPKAPTPQEAVDEFRRVTGASDDIARFYVDAYPPASATNVVAALQHYNEDVAAGVTGRAASPTRRPLLDDYSDGEGSSSRGATPPAHPAPLPPRHKLPQLHNFVDEFYDL